MIDPAAAAAAGPPQACQCPCRSYGHPPCGSVAETLIGTSAFRNPDDDRTPMCRPCAREHAALTSVSGASITARFPASTDERFTADALAHLPGKPIRMLITPGVTISGTVRDAVVIEDGRAAELTIDAARLTEFIAPHRKDPLLSRQTPTPTDQAMIRLSGILAALRESTALIERDPSISPELLAAATGAMALISQEFRDFTDQIGRKIRAVSTRNFTSRTPVTVPVLIGNINHEVEGARRCFQEAHERFVTASNSLQDLKRVD